VRRHHAAPVPEGQGRAGRWDALSFPALDAALLEFGFERACTAGNMSPVAHRAFRAPVRKKKAPARLKHMLVAALAMLSLKAGLSNAAPGGLDASNASSARNLYVTDCADCHGRSGNGDGPRAVHLRTTIRSFADCDWMSMRSDAILFLLIKKGSGAVGLAPEMPPFGGRLDDEQISDLIGYVRIFCPGNPKAGGRR